MFLSIKNRLSSKRRTRNQPTNSNPRVNAKLIGGIASLTAVIIAPVSIWALTSNNGGHSQNYQDSSQPGISFPDADIKAFSKENISNASSSSEISSESNDTPEQQVSPNSTVIINGQNIPVPLNGTVRKEIKDNSGSTDISLQITGNSQQSTTNDVNSSTSISVYSQSSTTGSESDTSSRHRGRVSSP